jgi:hypothetical protein
MSKTKRRREPFGGLQLAGDALGLLRNTPAHILSRYLIGTVPFVLALLFFAVDMSRSAFAPERCTAFAGLLAVLFIWMKCWQSAFMLGIRTQLLGHAPQAWSIKRILRLALLQSAIQPLGFILLPPALLLGLPFPAVHNLFQNLTLLADGERTPLSETLAKAWRLAKLWPQQSFTIIWLSSTWLLALAMSLQFGFLLLFTHFLGTGEPIALVLLILAFIIVQYITALLCPLGVLLAANIAILLLAVPWTARHLFGLPWAPATDAPGALFSDSFFLATFAITFLVLDPLMKAATVLRCFHGEAITTGNDIKLAFHSSRTAATAIRIGLLALLLTTPLLANAQPATSPAPKAQQLDTALDTALASPEYAWRLPRELTKPKDISITTPSWLQRITQTISNTISEAVTRAAKAIYRVLVKLFNYFEEILDWIFNRKFRDPNAPNPLAWMATTQGLFLITAMILLGALVIILLRLRVSRRTTTATPTATPTPDLSAHFVSADDLPTNEWLALAESLIRDGQLRLALRALFLGVLAELGQHRYLAITPYKSNRDYRRELHRRIHDRPDMLASFSDMVCTLESAWYGSLPVDTHLLDNFQHHQQSIFQALPSITTPEGSQP